MSMHEGHRCRLRKQLDAAGLDSFSDVQVLELLLTFSIPRRDVNPLAHALLDHFGSLSAVFDADLASLQKVPGVGARSAQLLQLIPALCRRYSIDRCRVGTILNTTEKVGAYLLPRFFGAKTEQLYLLCLDAKCKVLDCRMVMEGSVNTVGVSVRKVVEAALSKQATSVILAHNHPSGIALPSREDERTTLQIRDALDSVGIALLDHLIISENDFVSMADSGFFAF